MPAPLFCRDMLCSGTPPGIGILPSSEDTVVLCARKVKRKVSTGSGPYAAPFTVLLIAGVTSTGDRYLFVNITSAAETVWSSFA